MLKKYFLFCFMLLVSLSAHAAVMDTLFRQSNGTIAGNPKGKVTVVEFFDYQCSHCVKMAPTIASIIKKNPNVRVVFKDFPIRGPQSEFAALAAIAAGKQGKYYALNHALLETNLALTEENIFELARSVGINVTKLKKDMESSAVKKQLQSNYALAQDLNINGTPAFYIGRTDATDINAVEFGLGEMSQSELQTAINKWQ